MKRLALLAAALLLGPSVGAQDRAAPRSGYDFMSPETRAMQDDDFLNPAFFAVDQGRTLWDEVEGTAGKSCATCHDQPETTMKGVAARYPMVIEALGGLVNLEGRINACRTGQMGAATWDYDSAPMLAMTALVALQSRGLPMSVSVDGPAAPHFAAGETFYRTKRGQLNLACSDCHDDLAGHRLRGDVISQGQVNAFPVFRLLWNSMGSRHRMFAWCNTSVRAEPFAPGSPEYLDLELYLAWRGTGLTIEAPGVRR